MLFSQRCLLSLPTYSLLTLSLSAYSLSVWFQATSLGSSLGISVGNTEKLSVENSDTAN